MTDATQDPPAYASFAGSAMEQSAAELLDRTRPALERLAGDPNDVDALERLRSAFDSLDSPQMGPDAALLPVAARNLIDRLLDGIVAADAQSTKLLANACFALGGSEQERLDVIDQLDAFASGLGELPEAPAPPLLASAQPPRQEPPMLTVRHDGTRVNPGAFDVDAGVAEPPQLREQAAPGSLFGEPPSAAEQPIEAAARDAQLPSAFAPLAPAGEPLASREAAAIGRTETALPTNSGAQSTAELLTALADATELLHTQVAGLQRMAGPEFEDSARELSATSAEILAIGQALQEQLRAASGATGKSRRRTRRRRRGE